MAFAPEDLEKVAKLAKLALDPTQSQKITQDMNTILKMVAELQALDTNGIEPMAHPQDLAQPLRADQVTETDQREAHFKLTTHHEQQHYTLPQVIEQV